MPRVNGHRAETSGSKLKQAGVEEEEEELQTELRTGSIAPRRPCSKVQSLLEAIFNWHFGHKL